MYGNSFLVAGFFAGYRYNEQAFLVAQVKGSIFTYTIRRSEVKTFTGDFSPEREFVADKIKEVKAKNKTVGRKSNIRKNNIKKSAPS